MERKKNHSGIFFALLAKSASLVTTFKALKLLKPLITMLSMTISVIVYAFTYSPWLAVGVVGMLFVHEMGHVVALRRKGIPASAPVFIPMLGAVIFLPSIKNREDEAYIGYAGPLVGGAAALALFLLTFLFPSPPKMLLVISYVATFINLFNLVPIRPLDGGRVTQIFGRWFQWVGVGTLFLFTIATLNPGLLLIWIIVLDDLPMKRKMMSNLGVACQLGMMALMFTGFSHQGLGVDIVDILAATLLNLRYYLQTKVMFLAEEHVNESEPEIARAIRNKWLVLYFLLLAALLTLLSLQVPHLPKTLK